jgi:hypothetical protein
MDPREFHRLAERLASGATPAEYRTAIGRAYYSVFNVGCEHLRGLGFRIAKGGAAHGEIRHCLHNSGDTDITWVASELHSLHGLRIRADYQLDQTDVEKVANVRTAVGVASTLIQTLDAGFGGPNLARIETAIAAWRRTNGYP